MVLEGHDEEATDVIADVIRQMVGGDHRRRAQPCKTGAVVRALPRDGDRAFRQTWLKKAETGS
jgi:hypothetical protein